VIESEQPPVFTQHLQDHGGMTATAEGSIDVCSSCYWNQVLEHFSSKYRNVPELGH
jgi:hypothetical protein